MSEHKIKCPHKVQLNLVIIWSLLKHGTGRNGMERRFKVLKHGTMARDKILKHGTLTKEKLLKHGTLIAT